MVIRLLLQIYHWQPCSRKEDLGKTRRVEVFQEPAHFYQQISYEYLISLGSAILAARQAWLGDWISNFPSESTAFLFCIGMFSYSMGLDVLCRQEMKGNRTSKGKSWHLNVGSNTDSKSNSSTVMWGENRVLSAWLWGSIVRTKYNGICLSFEDISPKESLFDVMCWVLPDGLVVGLHRVEDSRAWRSRAPALVRPVGSEAFSTT